MAADRSMSAVRQGNRRLARAERRSTAWVTGKLQEARHIRTPAAEIANDQMLTDRMLSQAFRDLPFGWNHINVNVEKRIAVLHGVLTDPGQIRAVESAVANVPGVERVESYLHLPENPAPAEGPRHQRPTVEAARI